MSERPRADLAVVVSFPPVSRESRFADQMLRAYRDAVMAAVSLRDAARVSPKPADDRSGGGGLARFVDSLVRGRRHTVTGWTRRGRTEFERLVDAWSAIYLLSTDLQEGSRRAWLAAGRTEQSWRESLSDLEDLGGVV